MIWHDGKNTRMPWWADGFLNHLYRFRWGFRDQKLCRQLEPLLFYDRTTDRTLANVLSVSENVETFLQYVNTLLQWNRQTKDAEELERLEWILRLLIYPMVKACSVLRAFPGWDVEKDCERPYGCEKCHVIGRDECCCWRNWEFDFLRVMKEVEAAFHAVLRPEEVEKLLRWGFLHPEDEETFTSRWILF
jgi:hypothetical protein